MRKHEITLQDLRTMCSFCRQTMDRCQCLTGKGDSTLDQTKIERMLTTGEQGANAVIGGRYRLLDCVGRGGMGTVYRARHESLDKMVAVKILRSDRLMDEGTVLRFGHEARAASGLTHPNLATVFDYGRTEAGAPYLVMEFLDGESLAELLRREKTMNVDQAIVVFQQIAEALAYAHSKGVVHRDLKPNNVILLRQADGPCVAKLVDFGIAKFMPKAEIETIQSLTNTGEVFGSPLYMSPEQCEGKELDSRSDVYSFGCLMYETIVGEPPFCGKNPMETMFKQIHEPPLPIAKGALPDTSVANGLKTVISRALQKCPTERYQSMNSLLNDIALIKSGKKIDERKSFAQFMHLAVFQNKWVRLTAFGVAMVPICTLMLSGALTLVILICPPSKRYEAWNLLNSQAIQAYKTGNLKSAAALVRRAIATLPSIGGGASERVNLLSQLAKIYVEQGNLSEAKIYYSQASSIAIKSGLELEAEPCLIYEARCSERLGMGKEAAQSYAQAASLMAERLGPTSPALIEPLALAGKNYYNVPDLEASKSAYFKSVSIADQNPGIEPNLVATVYSSLARIATQEHQYEEAIKDYKKASDLKKSMHVANDWELQQIEKEQAALNAQLGTHPLIAPPTSDPHAQ